MSYVLDVNFVKPFVAGTMETLRVQCHVEVKVGKPFMRKAGQPEGLRIDIAGIIGITSSSFKGSIALCFPERTFLGIMGKMLGETYTSITPEVEDGAGELTNIIFGAAKRVLNDKGHDIQKALPSVIRGGGVQIRHLTPIPTVILPFETELGPFQIEVGIEPA